MSNKIIKTSKILSLVLRHKPKEIDLTLDKNGWANTQELIEKFSKKFYLIDFGHLQEVVEKDNKSRYSFNADLTMIRANQGHSVAVDLDLLPVEPPEFLYHGTVEKFIGSIKKEGLQKKNRQYVHLSADIGTAQIVGQRRGHPIILKIETANMFSKGYQFFLSENKVWLTDSVPVEFINF